ncbi:hypothetical protein [Motilibacter aurantiacus]|uniref:hypothetical protein n=1 Tax=Motilibacter aurantiacus TaxID=2714955 RepID=UPI00140E1C93|nr:hypothetical protein [Motilibacter aurantiacus]NHC45264.1 hypothetical protein [Motilibacter aurantiacus]
MALTLRRGEKVVLKGRAVTVTETAYEWLPRVRDHLIEVAEARATITYGELREELGLPYLVQGMGRLLDLLSEDCRRRGEPSLASLVVNASTGEVGHDFAGDPGAERELVHSRRWR